MATKPNFLDNLWSKAKGTIIKGVTIAGNAGGALIGVPALGSIAGNLLEKIPIKTMAKKAAESGTIDTTKIAETLVKNNVPVNDKTINTAVELIQTEAVNNPEIENVQKKSDLNIQNSALSPMGKIIAIAKKYWYVLAGVLVVIYFMTSKKKGFSKSSSKRRY